MGSIKTTDGFRVLRGIAVLAHVAVIGGVLAGCQKPEPRSYTFFMEDRIARDGILVRCESNPQQALNDIECANAQRAAAEIALQAERARAAELEAESERRMEAFRSQLAESERQAREAALRAIREELEAYEAQFRSPDEVPVDAAPELNGSVTPEGPLQTFN